MPNVIEGPLEGLYFPDHPDATIVNLMASIIIGRGGHSPHSPLLELPPERLADARHLLCIAVDGLGEEQLESYLATHSGSPFFATHARSVLSTVFPPTTASAVTTFLTGASPTEHAILGWYLNLPDDSVPGPRAQLSYGVIPHSRFSQAAGHWDRVRSFDSLAGLRAESAAFVAACERGLAYIYWPVHDSLCHEHGVGDVRTFDHLAEIDGMLAQLRDDLAGRGTALLVTADHGIYDTPPEQRIDLAAVPGLYDCLATLPCGDGGHASCFVRPRRENHFLETVAHHLGDQVLVLDGEELLAKGTFGPGEAHPALGGRVGDYLLIARDRQAFATPLPGAEPHFNVGNHGGMSAAEMRVPLYVVDC